MLKVIISSELDDNYKNFTVVRRFKDIRSLDISTISVLIIHKFQETEFDAGVFITQFYKEGITKFLYLNEEPSTTIKMVLSGINGYTLEDDFYFDDEEELQALIDELGVEQNESLADTSASIVGDFIQSFARGEEKIKAPLYLEQVTEAVNELSKSVNQKEYQIAAMGESAIDVFSRASDIIRNMSIQKNKLETQLKDLERIQKGANNVKPTFGNNIQFFPQVTYMRTPKLLLVREYTPCRYLTSFLIMYNQYVHYSLSKRTKFIVLYKNSFCESTRYNNFTKINNETYRMETLYQNEFLAVSTPKKDIMTKIFEQGVDIFIILDRMYENEDMITGRVKRLNAVSGIGDVEKFKLKPEQSILSVRDEKDAFCVLRSLKDYPTDFDAQVANYLQIYQAYFMKLDKYIDLR